MITIESLRVHKRACLGVKVELPDSPPLLLVIAEKGFVMCRFLNLDVAENLGVVAVVVSGVRDFEDVLDAEVEGVTSKAEALGVHVGTTGLDALEQML
jgi:uncharacterized protein YunC (DUF1805 family)